MGWDVLVKTVDFADASSHRNIKSKNKHFPDRNIDPSEHSEGNMHLQCTLSLSPSLIFESVCTEKAEAVGALVGLPNMTFKKTQSDEKEARKPSKGARKTVKEMRN